MKQQMGLNPAIVFLALSVWGYILGFVGLIIALPLTTLIISYYSEYVLHAPNPLYKKNIKKKKKHPKDNDDKQETLTSGNKLEPVTYGDELEPMTYGDELEPMTYGDEPDLEEELSPKLWKQSKNDIMWLVFQKNCVNL